jgi:hypothetical protein
MTFNQNKKMFFYKNKQLINVPLKLFLGLLLCHLSNADAFQVSLTSPSNFLQVGNSFTTGPIKIDVTKIEYLSSVGNDTDDPHTAASGAVLVAVQYTLTNISSQPVDSDSQPNPHLLDNNNVSYNSNDDASGDYETDVGATQDVLSDLNPGVMVSGADVFEVSLSNFNPSTWHLYFGDDQQDQYVLPNSN